MTKYAIDNRFQFRTKRSNSVSYTLACLSRQCEWKLKASSINRSAMFKIREFVEKHTCPLKDKVYTQHQANSDFIADIIKPKFRNYKRKYVPSDIVDDVKNDFGVDVPYMKAWRAKEKALTELMGEPAKSYKKLSGYIYILDKTYPGSHIRMKKTSENEFLYLFIALYAFIKGFECCRPIVVVDGSHIKTAYNGTFVSASTMDGAGNILPLAYGVIDSENDKSWTWFFEQFKEAYGLRESMCVVSDRHESIIKVVSKVYPNVPHFACIWHLWKNVETVDIRVKDYLELAGREKWSRLYAPVNQAWTMTSNIAESINSALVQARELPIFDFLEEVRIMFGRWNFTNRQNGSYTFTTLGKKFSEMLSINERKSARMTVIPSTEYVHTVIDEGRCFIVCIEKKTCSCKEFQMEEIPSPHTYDIPVYPLPDESEWKIPGYILGEVVFHRDTRDCLEG
ncbi:uncharacterized protein LOC132608345 [Lycium barbarum]|uniref:uncharacterized protein LOC132608345 n=1 Tax=Lycium barbarum TaxID=112863 RepID=UPI00293E7DF5|nr:uncharacterized protein LOC132608345 [Lycium barbarum]